MADPVMCCWRMRGSLCAKTSDDPLDLHAPAVHFIFEADDGGPVEVPRQAVAEHATTAELSLENRKDVLHGIELHAGGLLPIAAERTHATLHFVLHPPRLRQHACRTGVTWANDMVAVVRLAFDRLAAAGNDERCRRPLRRHRVAESMEAWFGGRIDFWTDVAARDGIDAIPHDSPFDQGLDVNLVECLETLFRKRRRRAQLAGAERRERTSGRLEDCRDPVKTGLQGYRIREPHALDGVAGQRCDAAGILADAGHEAIATARCFNGLDHDAPLN